MTYRILFIDEEKSAHGKFNRDFLKNNKDRFTGLCIFPEASLEDMIDVIFKLNPDAVLTDYSLNDYKTDIKYEVEYDGGDLAKEVHARRQEFPMFITTSLGDDAANGGADVKIIYEKYGSFNEGQRENNGAYADKQHLSFADKLFHEIKAYKKLLEDSSNEFDSLLAKRSLSEDGLSQSEEVRLIELDGILERLIDRKSKIPDDFKGTSNAKKIETLISLAQRIIATPSSDPENTPHL